MNLGGDLQNPKWMYGKAFGFLIIIITSYINILLADEVWLRAVMAAFLVWSSARLYYFMFYVIEKYIDPAYKFSGIISFLKYILKIK